MRTLVLGLGNPIHCDDGVGNRIAEILASKITNPAVTVVETSSSGLDLLDFVEGYERVIIIDAIQTRNGKAGQVYRLGLHDLSIPRHCLGAHSVDLATALELGSRLGLALPQEVIIFAIEVADVTTFSEEFTPAVEKAIPEVIGLALSELGGTG